ncbi:MAG: outer membrane beta-barrel protein [Ignavibacteria bacterium]
MKLRIFLLIIAFPALVSAQWHSLALKAGVYTPYDLKTGAIYGIDYSTIFNDNLSLLVSCDLYYKSIANDAYLESSKRLGADIQTVQRLSEWVGWHLPVTVKLRFEIPLEQTFFRPFIVGGLGYGVTHISYQSFADSLDNSSKSSSLTYNGLVWQFGGGILYRIGNNTDMIFEIIQNSAEFQHNEDNFRFTTLNSSGIIFRLGVSFEFKR